MLGRRGDEGLGLVAKIVIILVIIGVTIFFISGGAKNWKSVYNCKGTGMQCKDSCGTDERHALEAALGCSSSQVCCQSMNPNDGSGTGNCQAAGTACTNPTQCCSKVCTNKACVGNTAVTPPPLVLTPPSIRYTLSNGNTAATENAIYIGMASQGSYTVKVTFQTNTAKDCGDANIKEKVCPGNYQVDFVMSDQLHNRIATQTFELTTDGNFNSKSTATAPATGTPVLKPLTDYVTISTGTCAGDAPKTCIFTLTPKFGDSYTGQRLQLTTHAYSLLRQELDATKDIYFKIASPIAVSGLTQAWATKKDVSVRCVSPVICTNVSFTIVPKGTTSCTWQPSTADYPPTTSVWCKIQEGQIDKSSCSPKEADCWTRVGATVDPAYSGMIQNILKQYGGGQDISQLSIAFSALQGVTKSPTCIPLMNKPDESGPGTSAYRIGTFDRTSQNVKITLDRSYMQDQMFCAFGEDASGNHYTSGVPQPIKIDLIPPVGNIKFDPLTLKVRFVCDDGEGFVGPPQQGFAISGCKTALGTAYIRDATKFLPALASGPQSAAQWCPPPTSSEYATETRHEVVYTIAEVRVLCLRVTDNAGNTGLTMATVYNGYDVLAKTLLIALKK